MFQWLVHPEGSVFLIDVDGSTVRCQLPYPRPAGWREERRWNSFIIDAMEIALRAHSVFSTDDSRWGKAEREFFKWMRRNG